MIFDQAKIDSWREFCVAKLHRDGIVKLPWSLTNRQVLDLKFYLRRQRVYNAHVKAKATESAMIEEVHNSGRWPMFCHDFEDVVRAPHLFDVALQMLGIAGAYFNEMPYLYSMNAFWTQPVHNGTRYEDTHGWHRDGDDRKQLVLFIFGTDVMRSTDGPHLYQRGTHETQDSTLGRDFREPPSDIVEMMTGPAGTMFLTDTRGLHNGVRPEHYPRLLTWARFGVSDKHVSPIDGSIKPGPVSYEYDQLAPVDASKVPSYPCKAWDRDAVKLVVR